MSDLAQSLGIGVVILLAFALVVLFGIAVFLLVKLIRMFSVVRSEMMPTQGKVAFWAALAYMVFPVDLLPDPIFLDDVGVAGAALAFLGHLVSKYNVTPDGDEDDEGSRPVTLDSKPARSTP
jgi:uncharacterized membrane protein YkvA (DUF1232 family)